LFSKQGKPHLSVSVLKVVPCKRTDNKHVSLIYGLIVSVTCLS